MLSNVISRVGSLLNGQKASTAAIQTFLVKICILAINMGTGIITARYLGTQGRGELAAIVLWPQFLAYALTLGIPQALLYNLKKYPDQESELYSTSVLVSIVLGLVATGVGVIFLPIWLSQYAPELIRAAQLFMLTAPLSLLGLVFVAAFEARDEFTFSNQLRYFMPLTTLAALLILIAFGIRNPIAFGLTYVIPSVPIGIWMFLRLRSRYPFKLSKVRETTQLLLGYGVKAYGIDFIGSLSGKIGQALVVGLLNATSMGLYTVAISLSRVLNTFESAIDTVLLPKASARPVNEIVALTGRAVRISTMLTFLCVVPLMFLGPFFLRLLYGEEFVAATTIFRILLVEILISGTNWLLAKSFMAAGQPGVVTLLQGFGLSVTVPLMLVLIPRYGLVGAGLALLTSTSIRFFLVMACYPLIFKVAPPNLFITLDDLRYLKTTLSQRS
jgi:O-antigen/teichoic acid export membrane protein